MSAAVLWIFPSHDSCFCLISDHVPVDRQLVLETLTKYVVAGLQEDAHVNLEDAS